MSQSRAVDMHNQEFTEVVQARPMSFDKLAIEDLKDVRLALAADLGQATMYVREVLELRVGSVVPLDKLAGEMTDIFVNGIPLAKAEVVVIGDSIHVRVGEIFGATPEKDSDDEY